MTNSHIFSKPLSINSMHCTFRQSYFRATEYRRLVHVNPHLGYAVQQHVFQQAHTQSQVPIALVAAMCTAASVYHPRTFERSIELYKHALSVPNSGDDTEIVTCMILAYFAFGILVFFPLQFVLMIQKECE